jgi:hypothetical protein
VIESELGRLGFRTDTRVVLTPRVNGAGWPGWIEPASSLKLSGSGLPLMGAAGFEPATSRV